MTNSEVHKNAGLFSFIEYCNRYPGKKLFTFLNNDEEQFLTGNMLIQLSTTLGKTLQENLGPQEKVLIIYPQGLEFVYCLMACFYANVVAVPIPITDITQTEQILEKIAPIIKDSAASCILSDPSILEIIKSTNTYPVLLIDPLNAKLDISTGSNERVKTPEDIAVLLYTSGSTSQPKGIMINHRNLLSQATSGSIQWDVDQDSRIVSWMPQFHNFGLFFNILAPLLKSASSVLFSPESFLKDAEQWFLLIDKYNATHTAAANFAFDFCCLTIAKPTNKSYSLRSLKAIICGGEPVRKQTCENFFEKFKDAGLDENVFCPHYGLSETGTVTTKKPGQPIRFLSMDIPSLEQGKIKFTTQKKKRKFVASCGEIRNEIKVKIINPETCELSSPNEIGEIWLNSPSVAVGYMNQNEETNMAFLGTIKNIPNETGYLRTGDLGFIENNHLYIVGREKDVIIIHGKNHHPIDIEWTIKSQLAQLTLPLVVFSNEVLQEEKVIVVQEVEPLVASDYKKLYGDIIAAVSENHRIEVYEILFVKKGGIPKTGSGKVQRKACRNSYIQHHLSVLYQYRAGAQSHFPQEQTLPTMSDKSIIDILKRKVFSPLLNINQEQLDTGSSFSEFGLNSIQYVTISKKIEEVFNMQFAPVMLFKHRSLDKLAQYLSSHIDTQQYQNISLVQEVQNILGGGAYGIKEKDVAIVGLHFNLPGGAIDIESFWNNLIGEKDCITRIEDSRPMIINDFKKGFHSSNAPFPLWGGFVDQVDAFDASFFGISPLEAESMDPQQRKALELVWNLIEDAGYDRAQLAGKKVGLFLGVHNIDYATVIERQPSLMEIYGGYIDSGTHMTMIANRTSRWFNFHGSSEVVNTACSSSLVAVHHAVSSIYRGESEMAVAGGINLIFSSRIYYSSYKAGMLAPDGRCKAFSDQADGFVRSEGYGAVLLKPLSKAIQDNDHIYGIIKGAVINHDGQSNSLRAPNLNAQKELIKTAYREADLPVETISYIETHGTGTSLGDPIEFQAINEAFQECSPNLENAFCGLGSVKANIGHCESASGIAGLIKILLSMKYRSLPGILHYKSLNPFIQIGGSPFYIVEKTKKWERLKTIDGKEIPRRAGISSFGFGGANAHVVLEEYTPKEKPHAIVSAQNLVVILLSAKNEDRLRERVRQILSAIEKGQITDQNLADAAYTLQTGREAMEERLAMIVSSTKGLEDKLKGVLDNQDGIEDVYLGQVKRNKEMLAAFANDEEIQGAIEKWLQRRKYTKILDLWVKGLTIDWNKLYDETTPCRVSLPAYPFARELYWVPDGNDEAQKLNDLFNETEKNQEGTSDSIGNSGCTNFINNCYNDDYVSSELMTFEETWQVQDIPKSPSVDIKTLVCFLTKQEYTQVLAEEVKKLYQTAQVIFVTQSASFKKLANLTYSINPTDRNHYIDTFRDISHDFKEVDAILYLWPIEDQKYIMDLSCNVHILQAIESAKLKCGRLLFGGAFDNPMEQCMLESWIGFERSLGLVMPNTKVTVFAQEADRRSQNGNIKDWVPNLLAELQAQKFQSALYLSGRRHVCQVRPTQVIPGGSLLKPGGTYLITGGCGGLGIIFARHLAKTMPVNLILNGRASLDDEKRAMIKALETLGAKVFYLQADVSDPNRMKEGLAKAKEQFGQINGVVHAAGITGNQNIFEKDLVGFQKVLAPKISGTLVLDEVIDDDLDFICYFSSSSAVIGDFGSCDYAIGNRFQMAYAHYRDSLKRPEKAFVINWPLWGGGGMGMGDDENTRMYLQSSGQRVLETKEGLAVFDQVLSQSNTQHLVLVGQPERIYRFLGLFETNTPSVISVSGKGRNLEMKGMGIEQCLEWDLKSLVAKLLRISREKLGTDINLADFGFDSISLAQFAITLTNHFTIDITPALFFGYSSIEKLTQYFLKEHPQVIREFYNEEVIVHPSPKFDLVPSQRPMPKKTVAILKKETQVTSEPIAIIGISGRFPRARNIQELWDILSQGQDVVEEIPIDRFDWRHYYGDSINSKWCGCIPGVGEFDPLFFEISPREAQTIDPRQRLLLQEAWKALEDAGYGPQQLKNNKTGIFVGIEQGDYQQLMKADNNITSNNNAILAARLAYFLDLNGPVMAIDTACSSGLVAAHQACLSLRNNECDTAIAASATLILAPDVYIKMSKAGMLSESGKCYSFDKRANGMVPGEAIAVVVLKRLSRAKADGDPIYAIIRGSGINYDGKTNGITAPSGLAQANLLKDVYSQYKINTEEVDYIVTHGTGTKLGDPVEINALYEVFKNGEKKQGYCALTSTKTNFGHTLAASGLVSLISLVQAMRHNTIPASLHCNQENDYIKWDKSPFYINKNNKQWSGKDLTGAVSAFGMSGTNAHMVVGSYNMDVSLNPLACAPYYLLALSAKTQEALQEKITDMIVYLQNIELKQDLSLVSHTLLEGRHHFNYRCAIVVQDNDDAIYVLGQMASKEKLSNLFQGKVSREFKGQKLMQQYTHDLVKQVRASQDNENEYRELLLALADLYCQGYEIPWGEIYGEVKPRRISLPSYPFARERYWIPEGTDQNTISIATATIHPLLQQNTSDFSGQRYSSVFTGNEFFLAGHIINGQKILPGVAYLEMARAAVQQAIGKTEDAQFSIQLKNVVWVKPIVLNGESVQVNLSLYPEDNGDIAYEIYTQEFIDQEKVLHSQGKARLTATVGPTFLDIQTLQAECNLDSLTHAQCYDAFRSIGFNYNTGYQCIDQIFIGNEQVLARLSLPSANVKDTYVLDPGLMDSALQASIGLLLGTENAGGSHTLKPLMPFGLEQIEILDSCSASMWARIRHCHNSSSNHEVQKLDIDLCDDQGKLCVRIQGFSSRVSESGRLEKHSDILTGNIMLTPVWDLFPVEKGVSFSSSTENVFIVGGSQDHWNTIQQHYPQAQISNIQPGDSIDAIIQKLENQIIDHIIWVGPEKEMGSLANECIIAEQDHGAIQVFRIIKAMIHLGHEAKPLIWSIITIQALPILDDAFNPTHASIHGLAGSMAKEYPGWRIRLVDVQANQAIPFGDIFMLPPNKQGNALAYRQDNWYHQQLIPLKSATSGIGSYKTGGVYVVIGGAGGIGEVWSEYVMRTYDARVIWLGRREKDAAIQDKLDRLSALGHAPLYLSVDATNLDDLQKAYKEIKSHYTHIDGLIHSAIVLMDQSLVNMEEERFRAGLSAKVDVSVRMAQVFQSEPLDFVMFFSSLQSFTKAPGQSNYAAGCTFKDSFALQLAKQWACAVKIMNWGYWGSVGIVASKEYQQRMAVAGIGSIEPAEAMEALETLHACPINQMALIKTTKTITLAGVSTSESISICKECTPSHNLALKSGKLPLPENSSPGSLDNLLGKLLLGQLQALGWCKGMYTGVPHDIPVFYNRWFEESVGVLQQRSDLYANQEFSNNDLDVAWEEWDTEKLTWFKVRGLKAQVELVEATLLALPDILTGKRMATDIIFPNSSMELVEGVYKYNQGADYYNEVLACNLESYLQGLLQQDPSAKIRIFEIGAGTGGTSKLVFEKLQPYKSSIQEYCYTDLSKAFLMHAGKEYVAQNPFLTTKIFNVELPITSQGVDLGGYDVVIAANVLHATKNIKQTLRNAKAALKKNGLLLLNEISNKSLFTHLTFGLLEGWWLYDDPELRIPGCPGLFPHTWQKILEGEGFTNLLFPAQEAHVMGQQIIAAQSNGVVRQKKPVIQSPMNKQVPKTGFSKQKDTSQPFEINHDTLYEKSVTYFKKVVGETLNIPAHQIDSSESLGKYGLDSILVVQLSNFLSKALDHINSTLFFEYHTIDALIVHFMNTQKEALARLVGLDAKQTVQSGYNVVSSKVIEELTSRTSGRFQGIRSLQIGKRDINPSGNKDIAIIGLSGRYPGAKDIQQFWNNLKEGKNCITEIPKDRWHWEEYYDLEKGKIGKMYTKWGGFIEDVDKFDPLFFHISPLEAEKMDPQERLFLEETYSSIQDAGYAPSNLCDSKKVGVFVGIMNANYPTGSSYWSIANRVSYLMNFHGPSMSIDTACSSSLTAIHLALESLYSGTSECAIAGGVNLILDPVHYLKLSSVTMLTSGNQCKAFGDQADGFVDGEGVGVIVLKPLAKAIDDGDHIYGIIKGSMINAGGKTNGYTVPNPDAQFRVIFEALHRANIEARAISYIEAHGTGTFLGDPIEIAGLTKTFREYTKDEQFCAIGSVKSNIGHCESAAGIAGLTKVLLQLKHGQIAPSLHSKTLNPNIDFSHTPFTVQQELSEWKRPVVGISGVMKEYPRIAGISSFGAGGANAHVIIEEYVPDIERPKITVNTQNPAIIVLCAKNDGQLRAQALQILQSIDDGQIADDNLLDAAYTLQVGREAMEERLGLLVGSVEDLKEKLRNFVEGKDGIDGLYKGQVKRNNDNLFVFGADEDMAQTIEAWISKRKYTKLLDLWVKGLVFDWRKIYGETKLFRISLPTYPFAREHYWVTEVSAHAVTKKFNTVANVAIHPLLHQNTSDISGLRFSSVFTGDEIFLAHHVVNGQKILPGVAFLEMAYSAATQVAGIEGGMHIQLRDVVWVTPIAVNGEPARVNISLYPEGDGRISYEISTQAAIDEEQVVHSYGVILFSAKPGDTFINIQALRAECSFGTLTREQCYAAFKFMGIDYGPGHQGIEQLFIGQGQVLAKLSLPIDHTKDKYILHPGLMDSALQSSIGLMAPEGYGNLKPMLPFALEQIEILGNCTPSMWALVRYSHGSSFNDKVQKLDIDLCDSLGKINVRLKGFSSRVLGAIPVNKNLGTLMLQPTNIDVMEVPAKIKHLADIGLLMSTESNNDVLLKDEEFYQHLSEQIFKGEISKQQVEMILTSKMGGQNG